jgi:predicted amidohydrolase
MAKTLTVGALQLPTLGENRTTLEFYFKRAKERNVKLLLFGEYVVNDFFKTLKKDTKEDAKKIAQQTKEHIEILKALSKSFDIILIVPIITIKKGKFYKQIAKITPKRTSYYEQQILIAYPHWNEEKFFSNPIERLKEPLLFNIEGFKLMIVSGYELHFDYFWNLAQQKRVDLVLLPTASTFASHERWKNIMTTKAFMYGTYILRANRLGDYTEKKHTWHFYGDTMLVNPDGTVEMMLEDKESMLIETIEKSAIKQKRKLWGFHNALQKRGMIT